MRQEVTGLFWDGFEAGEIAKLLGVPESYVMEILDSLW